MKHGKRRTIAFAAISAVAATGLAASAAPAQAAVSCSVAYTPNYWGSGFTIGLKVSNTGDALTSWSLKFTFGGDQKITNGWNGTWSQSGNAVTVSNAAWNGGLASGGSLDLGAQGTWSSSQAAPTGYSLNGVTCGGGSGGGGTTTTTSRTTTTTTRGGGGGTTTTTTRPITTTTTRSVTSTTTRTTSTSTTTGGGGGGGTHVDNAYVGKGYVNPEWKARAESVSGGSRVSNTPTAVWLDRIAAIEGTTDSSSNGSMGLRDHLDAALAQGATYAQFVIYDLPGRDCAALASNGELGPTELPRYKTEYIDPIAAIEADAKYKSLRIINIIEIDSLPNLVTNQSIANCATMQQNGGYVQGVAYALGKLHAAGTNIYNYVDAAHHGWLGWDTNFGPAADLFVSTAKSAVGGVATVDGYITNTANYSATTEPYLSITDTVNGTSIRQSKWVDWNQYVDEQSFATAFRSALVSKGMNSSIGMLIDTSRNGWGGPSRPTAKSTATNVDDYVNKSRIDRRIHAGNWCNQSGAGLGARPTASPATGIDAYVWIKPPGESDGSSTAIPNNEGKGFDRMCDPTYTGNSLNGNNLTGALSGAPISGAWFAAQFAQLMDNAYPPLS
jgi:cellulose 1,4-beta-cellobiosidase